MSEPHERRFGASTKPVDVEAMRVYDTNIKEVAHWVGGEVQHMSVPPLLRIPSLDGVLHAIAGKDVVVKYASNGRFDVLSREEFDEKFEDFVSKRGD